MMRSIVLGFVLLLAAGAKDVSQAIAETQGELRARAADLSTLRETLRAEKAEAGETLANLEAEVQSAREQLSRIQRAAELARESRSDLAEREARLDAEQATLSALLKEHRRNLPSLLTSLQAESITNQLQQIDESLGDSNLVSALEQLLDLDRSSLATRLEGQVLAERQVTTLDGTVISGQAIVAGSLQWFAGEPSGPLIHRNGQLMPTVIPETDATALRAVAAGEPGLLRVDPTGGKLLARSLQKETGLDHIRSGGVLVIPLLVLGGLAALIAIFKTIHLYTVRVGSTKAVDQLLDLRGDSDKAHAFTESQGRLWGQVFNSRTGGSGLSPDAVGERMQEQILAALPRLERLLSILAVTAAAAPLLGLLGTVTGMIDTFAVIREVGTGDPRPLSGGISTALVTTEVGLAVAIPALLVHAWLVRRVKRIVNRLDGQVLHYVQGLRNKAGNDAA